MAHCLPKDSKLRFLQRKLLGSPLPPTEPQAHWSCLSRSLRTNLLDGLPILGLEVQHSFCVVVGPCSSDIERRGWTNFSAASLQPGFGPSCEPRTTCPPARSSRHWNSLHGVPPEEQRHQACCVWMLFTGRIADASDGADTVESEDCADGLCVGKECG